MAVEEQSKLDFITVLTSINRKFDIIHAKWIDDRQFEAKFRTQISRLSDDYNALCDEWVDIFSEATTTTWVKKISNTGPKIKFRKQYQCWTLQGEVQKALLFDARRCKGTIDVKVLTDNPQTRRKNKHIKLGLNVVIKVNFFHLHEVNKRIRYSFFVHPCLPLPEAPKPAIQPNKNLSKLIASILEKGRHTHPETTEMTTDTSGNLNAEMNSDMNTEQENLQYENINHTIEQNIIPDIKVVSQDDILGNQLQVHNIEQLNMIQLNQFIPLQGMDSIKLQVPADHLPQLTQVVVSGSHLDLTEPLMMCQPALMFDPSQVIPISGHSLPHHFVQVHNIVENMHNSQGQY